MLPGQATATADSLAREAAQADRAGDYVTALKDYQSALALVEAESGADSVAAAAMALNVADTQFVLGHYPEALALARRALSTYQARQGPADPGIARALDRLGATLCAAGSCAEAKPYLERGIGILDSAGIDTPALAALLNDYAFDLLRTGDYAGAKAQAERAIATYDRSGNSAEAGQAWRTLAHVLNELGDVSGSERAQAQALAVLERNTGPQDPRVADLLVTMGNSSKNAGHSERAREDFERAAKIYTARLGPGNTRVGGALDSLAQTLLDLHRYEEARQTFQRALQIQNEVLGPRSVWSGNIVQGLAKVANATGDYAEAKRLYEQNLDIWREQLGPTHPFTAASLTQYADVLAHLGERKQAMAMALEAARIRTDQIGLTIRTVEEREALQYAGTRMTSLDTALTLAQNGDDADRRAAWDAIVRTRGLVLDEMAQRRRAVRQSTDPRMPALTATLADARSRLAHAVLEGKGRQSAQEYGRQLESARAAMQNAEQAVAVHSAEFRRVLSRQQAGLDQVQAALPPGAALVAYTRYRRKNFQHAGDDATPSYAAFVLRSHHAPAMIALGPEKHIAALVEAWRAQIDRERDWIGHQAARNEASYRVAARALRQAVWDPLANALAGATLIFIVPDGALQAVNFAALPSGPGYLAESAVLLHTLSAERDLVQPPTPVDSRRMLAVGNPAFQAAGIGERPVVARATFRGTHSTCGDFSRLQFEPLPATDGEVRALDRLWKREGWPVEILTGKAATEAAVKQSASGLRVLHLATHGFFLANQCAGNAVVGENPLLRSGLALAGANRRNQAGAAEEDGVLTAEEAASLDLDGTDWVVLSGCDTGLGVVQSGEGVLGLRRAFLEAGAHTVITSLWPVEDEAARRWMTALYRARFHNGQSTAAALHRADVEMLRQRRAAGQSTHPFYWASFIAVGDWR